MCVISIFYLCLLHTHMFFHTIITQKVRCKTRRNPYRSHTKEDTNPLLTLDVLESLGIRDNAVTGYKRRKGGSSCMFAAAQRRPATGLAGDCCGCSGTVSRIGIQLGNSGWVLNRYGTVSTPICRSSNTRQRKRVLYSMLLSLSERKAASNGRYRRVDLYSHYFIAF